jgi:hypothetical protein
MEAVRSIRISPSATPNRRNDIPPRTPNNSFEKGNRTDERGISYLDKDGKPLKMKESFRKKDYEPSRESIKVTGGNS